MNCKLITTASDYSKTEKLRHSLDRQGWPYHVIVHEWKGFGCKILETYNYLKTSDVTHFFYSDSYDTYCLGQMSEALEKINGRDMLWSAEKACYPYPDWAVKYPEHDSPFKYLNGGGWFCSKDKFIEMVEQDMPTYSTVDQTWFTQQLFKGFITLDYFCEVFQTIAFCDMEKEFAITDRLINKKYGTLPIFIHGNGHTPLGKIYDL